MNRLKRVVGHPIMSTVPYWAQNQKTPGPLQKWITCPSDIDNRFSHNFFTQFDSSIGKLCQTVLVIAESHCCLHSRAFKRRCPNAHVAIRFIRPWCLPHRSPTALVQGFDSSRGAHCYVFVTLSLTSCVYSLLSSPYSFSNSAHHSDTACGLHYGLALH